MSLIFWLPNLCEEYYVLVLSAMVIYIFHNNIGNALFTVWKKYNQKQCKKYPYNATVLCCVAMQPVLS